MGGAGARQNVAMAEHAVLVYVKPSADREIALDEIEDSLADAIERAGVANSTAT